LKIDLKWERPYRLRDGSRQDLIYACAGLDRVSTGAGIYVFARRHGSTIAPLYIGQAHTLRDRVKSQLNHLKLMMKIRKAQTGHRVLFVAHLLLHPGQNEQKALKIVESALIKHAMAQGHDLINKQLTKTRTHAIRSKGNTSSRQLAPSKMLVEKRKE
jgi:hypothetical protein